MIEIAAVPGQNGLARVGFGGDTLNTAIYLSRLLAEYDHQVFYGTLLGDDPYSAEMLKAWEAEGIDCRLVENIPNREAGLYTINVDDTGEREFHYWRAHAPARELLEGADGLARLKQFAEFDGLYFSGISLAILHDESRARLLELARQMKAAGRAVIFDTNHRSRLWRGDEAKEMNLNALRTSTIALPSGDDLLSLFGPQEEGWRPFLASLSIPEIVIKNNGEPLDIFYGGEWRTLPVGKLTNVVDTTAAGDSFNAGYLAAKLRGAEPLEAAIKAHRLACKVIGHSGAIIPAKDSIESRSRPI